MRSASRQGIRLTVLAVCGFLLLGSLAGCSTTQEKAARQQARAKHILEARAERQRERKHHKGEKPRQKGGQDR